MLHRSCVSLTLALACAGAIGVRAATPVFWTVAGQESLLEGEVENLSIDRLGRLTLGPAIDLVHETTAPFLWSIAAGPDGTLYVGSGNEGKVFRIEPGGAGSVFFDADELEVHALAVGPSGDLYVGTSPEGRVYRVGRDGARTTFFDPEDKYIWALAFDRQANLFVATGEKGTVYRVAPDGRSTAFYAAQATHAVALAVEPGGQLLVGTGSPGTLVRVDSSGKGFVLLDPGQQEIHAIRLDGSGAIYVTALSEAGGATRPPEPPRAEPARPAAAAPVASVTTEITAVAVADESAGGQTTTARVERGATRGAVYRIAPDGLWDLLWQSGSDLPYDISLDADGSILVGTGRSGKIFRLTGDPIAPALLVQAGAQQVVAFLRDARGVHYYVTANPGRLFRVSAARADRGTYVSEVRDARTVAGWGILSWRATLQPGGRVEIYTRSGNTSSPDATWSPWEGPYRNPEGEQIVNPKARYLQWKAELSGRSGDPVLTSVTVAYLPQNARPQLASITVHPPGVVFQEPFPTGDPDIAGLNDVPPDRRQLAATGGAGASAGVGRRAYEKGFQTFVWRAEDADQDDLSYSLFFRREGETSWKLLKDGLIDAIYVWDTTSVPDGTYLVKIAASDALANAPGTALVGELESGLFDIDNGPPQIRVTALQPGPPPRLLFEVRDGQSPLRRVEFSVDAERWRPVYPLDGIADGRVESYALTLDGAAAVAGVILRAVDAAANVATARGTPPAGGGP